MRAERNDKGRLEEAEVVAAVADDLALMKRFAHNALADACAIRANLSKANFRSIRVRARPRPLLSRARGHSPPGRGFLRGGHYRLGFGGGGWRLVVAAVGIWAEAALRVRCAQGPVRRRGHRGAGGAARCALGERQAFHPVCPDDASRHACHGGGPGSRDPFARGQAPAGSAPRRSGGLPPDDPALLVPVDRPRVGVRWVCVGCFFACFSACFPFALFPFFVPDAR
ncbi:hypothetical protein BC828DRAFT_219072 [Blastocladiella britannica]|nr:hypothetical protein BC828DRAFT_219072 [Blastocladiella britannica]